MEKIGKSEQTVGHPGERLDQYLHSPQRYEHAALALLGIGVLLLIANLIFDLMGVKPGLLQISLVAAFLVSGLFFYQRYQSKTRHVDHTPET